MVSSSHPSGISPAHTLTLSLSQTWPHVFPAVSITILPRKETAISQGFFKRQWRKRSRSERGGHWSPAERDRHPVPSHSGNLVPGLHLKQWAEAMRAPSTQQKQASPGHKAGQTWVKKVPRMRKQSTNPPPPLTSLLPWHPVCPPPQTNSPKSYPSLKGIWGTRKIMFSWEKQHSNKNAHVFKILLNS